MVKVQFCRDQPYARFIASGRLDLAEVVAAFQRWQAHPDFSPKVDLLWDLRACDWQPALEDFLLIRESILKQPRRLWRGKHIACVVDSATNAALIDAQFGAGPWPFVWRGFLNTKTAEDWLLSVKESSLG